MAKKIKAVIKLQIPAGQATPAPPVGPALAQQGVNIAEFCQKFNEATKAQIGWKLPVEVTVFEDRSYNFKAKTPLVTALLKRAAAIEKGSGKPNTVKAGKITRAQLREIAQKKLPDLSADTIEAAEKTIEGTAKSMGIEIT
ncbi:MAG: 50S ribosomal protein L11 [Candidatus Wildermuthbacteria bacterium GWA2_46_15]|uniref:Large ribosomal subunit protein uL11 n=1 Tax=Candidatus Wildermuthbacteria bacterium GWA2_46_15 TaxID=1802443 RepID=A0A1G2QSP4_9BACT|nr:MAG: 50S ribosomal protein L11 [Candidatus Wildermuthbacteria bacterium GWA2_46_15]